MEPSPGPWPDHSSPQKIIIVLAVLCFVGSIALVGLALAVRQRLQEGNAGPLQAATLPAEECRPSTLALGGTTFPIRDLRRAADSSLSVPADTSGIAYRVEGTGNHPVFVLSPTAENLAVVSMIDLGSEATAIWHDCTFTIYQVSSHEPGAFDASALPDPSRTGITVYFPIDSSGLGFVFTAGGSGEQVHVLSSPGPSIENTQPPPVLNPSPPPVANTMENVFPTPEGDPIATPDYSQIQAEIGVLEVSTSPDGKTVTLDISIYNYGTLPVTLSTRDVALTEPDGTALALVSSEPSLPAQIAATETGTFTFTFPRPASSTATLRILTVEYDLEDY